VVHHFAKEECPGIFQGMHTDSEGSEAAEHCPSILIVTRPQLEIDYPLWNEAPQVWAQNQPSVQDIAKDLQQAGFSNVSQALEPCPCSVSLERWQGTVQKRFRSTFSKFSNQGEIFLETAPICRGNSWWLSQTFRNTSNVALLFCLFCHFKSSRRRAKLLESH
jgi:hypothetical protein